MMRLAWLLGMGMIGVASVGQAVVLWSVPSQQSPTMLPAYQGQGSPFPQPVVAPVTSDSETDEMARAAEMLRQVTAKAKRLAMAPGALQISSNQLNFKGITNGVAGVRVLIRNSWVGLNEAFTARYALNPVVIEALRELRELDPDGAERLQEDLNARRAKLEQQGVKITNVNIRSKQITLETPLGRQQLPLILVP